MISSPEGLYGSSLPKLAEGIFPARASAAAPGAEPLGFHLEGPFLDPGKRGAHDAAHVRAPDPRLLCRLLDLAPVRVVTLAPDLSVEAVYKAGKLAYRGGPGAP